MNRKVLAVGLAVAAPLIVLLLVGLGRNPHAVKSPLVGRKAPPFSLTPVGGGAPVSLENMKGRAVVLNFWATWCVPCAEEHDVLVSGAKAWAEQAQFLGVVYQDEEDEVLAFFRKHGRAYPSVFDESGKTAIAYGVFGVPETFFIAPDGTIVEKFAGPLSAEDLSGYLRKALGHSP
jgi:cytochrome c biogenesis protein CcmG, thiol:disulfide interchange protein DsbE